MTSQRLTAKQREAFDALVEGVIESLPARIRELIDEVPVEVMDLPSGKMLAQLKREGVLETDADGTDLCGLHTGIGLTERSIEDPQGIGLGRGGWVESLDDEGVVGGVELERIHLFRVGIVSLAFASEEDGGFEGAKAGSWDDEDALERIEEEIRITILHEIGHHFGLDEEDLDRLGYG